MGLGYPPNAKVDQPASARSCLLILLCTCLGAAWSLEQPSGSLAEYYPAFRETIRSIFDSGGPDAAGPLNNIRTFEIYSWSAWQNPVLDCKSLLLCGTIFFAAPISPNTYSGAERKMVDAPLQKPYPEAPLCILQFQTDSSLGQRRSSRVEGQEERGEWCGDSNPLHWCQWEKAVQGNQVIEKYGAPWLFQCSTSFQISFSTYVGHVKYPGGWLQLKAFCCWLKGVLHTFITAIYEQKVFLNSNHPPSTFRDSNAPCSPQPTVLRIYPVPFARAFCDMLEDLKAACKGKPELPDPVPEALTSFQQMEYADPEIWRTTCFTEVYDYLRRNKKLRIPAEWQALLPARLYEVS